MLHALSEGGRPDALLIDIGLPDASGLDVIPKRRVQSPQSVVIVLTVYEDDEKIFKAVCAGTTGYFVKRNECGGDCEFGRGGFAGRLTHGREYCAKGVGDVFQTGCEKLRTTVLVASGDGDLQPIVTGMTTKEVASRVGLSIHTVDTHLPEDL